MLRNNSKQSNSPGNPRSNKNPRSKQYNYHENNLQISEVAQTYDKYTYVPRATTAECVAGGLVMCYMQYISPLLETCKAFLQYPQNFIIQNHEFKQMGRSCICIDHEANADRQIRYDTRCYFNVRSKADISRLNLPHGDDN